MATWQIALIICCAVLVFVVAVVALLSCYCKARRRLVESEDHEEDATYYHQRYADANGAGAATTGNTMVGSTSSNNLSGGNGSDGNGNDSYNNRQTYSVKAPQGSYVGNEGRYMIAMNGAADSSSPERNGSYRPSSGSLGEMATTPYSSQDRRTSSINSQAVTL